MTLSNEGPQPPQPGAKPRYAGGAQAALRLPDQLIIAMVEMPIDDAAIVAALERVAVRLEVLEGARQWPALMRPDTLRAYLDVRSDSSFARMLRALKKRGYPGPDKHTHRHVKDVVDRYLDRSSADREATRQRILKAARGEI